MWIRSSDSDTADSDIFGFGAASAVFRGFFPGYSTERVPDTSFFWSMVKMNVRDQAGTVTLRSADPRDTPLINFNWFQEGGERDLQALGEAVQLAMDMFEGAGAPYAPYEVVEPTPGVELHQAIKDNTFSHHVQSTCRMGPKGDRDYCVDSKFRVNGVEGLRVVDASVFPHSMGAFPVAPTFVASRKAFHDIVSEL
jgi:choline dehydrogenase